ncbi:GNAT family N-acetyltransferase [Cellulophaga sp. HaHa_2_95]|uniref:GNAT family N-acetyltransferase n=1 Tax=Cellulophaga sp. HaHa_2_95 TaxID=2745558 RepID=UPI001C4E84AD|nr:GNAT family N-acetyltransferase [Cellulophaga sp. HaHa_2_95]QXP55256.1 GNAT family N-acetyltransferase [Cellulophaga sp. HaHa_2_95]
MKILSSPLLALKVVELNSKKSIEEYKALLNSFWSNNIYYNYEYMAYYENNLERLSYFILKKEGVPIIIMPFFIRQIDSNIEFSNTFYDVVTPYGYGGPLFNEEFKNYLGYFWKKVDAWYSQNNIVSEFVRFSLRQNSENYTGNLEQTLTNVRGLILEDQEKQWQNFVPKVRNNFRTAEKNNLAFVAKIGSNISLNDISEFHSVYIDTMKRNNASEIYFFSLEYFQNLIFSNAQNFSIVFTEKDGVVISTELIIFWKDTMYAFLGGTRGDYFHLRPNDFLRVNIIKLASELKFKYYVLGGGRVDGDGLYKSKKSFFPKDEDPIFYTGRKIINSLVYSQLTQEHTSINTSFFPAYRLPR